MHVGGTFAVAALVVLVGCGSETGVAGGGRSGVEGTVHLGPQCPVVTEDQPCDDDPAAAVLVTVYEAVPGDSYTHGAEVARGRTDASGRFRIAVKPGEYVVSAEAGMFCELMDARVAADVFTTVDVPCDTGIR